MVPNPATTEPMQPPVDALAQQRRSHRHQGGVRNLPADQGTIRIYTVAGDLVEELPVRRTLGGVNASGTSVSRNGQDVTSGVYSLPSRPTLTKRSSARLAKFVVIR